MITGEETKRLKVKERKSQRDGGGGVLTTTETTRDNFFASLTHRERGFLKVNGGKESKSQRDKESKRQRDKEMGAAKRTMGQRDDVISCFVDFFALKV